MQGKKIPTYIPILLTQRAVLRAQLNSLKARFPEVQLEFIKPSSLSGNAHVFEGYEGYVMLPRREVRPNLVCAVPLALGKYCDSVQVDTDTPL